MLALLLTGLIAGILGGIFGIGGAIIIIPLMVLMLKFPQHLAQGTTLAAMIPPIGILAAWRYYQRGQVDIKAALLIAAGFVLGGLIGGELAQYISGTTLKRGFGLLLLAVGVKFLFTK